MKHKRQVEKVTIAFDFELTYCTAGGRQAALENAFRVHLDAFSFGEYGYGGAKLIQGTAKVLEARK